MGIGDLPDVWRGCFGFFSIGEKASDAINVDGRQTRDAVANFVLFSFFPPLFFLVH